MRQKVGEQEKKSETESKRCLLFLISAPFELKKKVLSFKWRYSSVCVPAPTTVTEQKTHASILSQ